MSILRELKTPIFNAESTYSIPKLENYIITIIKDDLSELNFNLVDFIKLFKIKEVNCRLTSVSGWSVRAIWQGILWQDFLNYIKPAEYNYVIFESYGGYSTAIFKEDLENPRIIMAIKVGGQVLEEAYGGPIRMVIPNLWGYKSCKWLHKIIFSKEYTKGYWESFGYDDRGLIKASKTFDVNSKTYIDIGDGEVLN
ncbi:MAG: molybdopterin-dependent oxidoreductase [Deferribacterota bacterium]|nr:molybdopterin-dependent oxidoreductase [Deferribacterota bacterium]